jgi:hypothetical protein
MPWSNLPLVYLYALDQRYVVEWLWPLGGDLHFRVGFLDLRGAVRDRMREGSEIG